MSNPFNPLRKIMIERQQEKQRIKKEFVDSGAADNMIESLNKKRDKSDINPDNLFK